MDHRLPMLIRVVAALIANLVSFSFLFVVAWGQLGSPLALGALVAGGAVAAIWTRTLTAVTTSAALTAVLALGWLGWAQLAVDSAGTYTPVSDVLPYVFGWPGIRFTAIVAAVCAILAASGYYGVRAIHASIGRIRVGRA